MKLKTVKSLTVEVTTDEVKALLTRLVEKKSSKKVVDVTFDDAGWKFSLVEESEESNLDEPKA
jgi:hypothetical protein